jgi:PilZ domain-containing protein
MTVIERLKTALGLGTAPDGVERREHPRIQGPRLTLRFGGEKYKSVDWSLGGCRIHAAGGQLQLRQQIAGRIKLAGADGRGEFTAEIVRIDAEGHVSLRWLDLSPHIFVAMHGLGD